MATEQWMRDAAREIVNGAYAIHGTVDVFGVMKDAEIEGLAQIIAKHALASHAAPTPPLFTPETVELLKKHEAEMEAAPRATEEQPDLREALQFVKRKIEQWAPEAKQGPTDAWGGLALWIESTLGSTHAAPAAQPGQMEQAQMEWAIKDISTRYHHALFCRDESCHECNYWREIISRGPAPQMEGAMQAGSQADPPSGEGK